MSWSASWPAKATTKTGGRSAEAGDGKTRSRPGRAHPGRTAAGRALISVLTRWARRSQNSAADRRYSRIAVRRHRARAGVLRHLHRCERRRHVPESARAASTARRATSAAARSGSTGPRKASVSSTFRTRIPSYDCRSPNWDSVTISLLECRAAIQRAETRRDWAQRRDPSARGRRCQATWSAAVLGVWSLRLRPPRPGA